MQRVLCRRAAGFCKHGAVGQHCLVFFQPVKRLPQYLGRADMSWQHDSVVHPFTLATGSDDTRVAQIGKMTRHPGLRAAQYFNEVADTNLLLAHEVEQAKASVVTEGLEKPLHVKR